MMEFMNTTGFFPTVNFTTNVSGYTEGPSDAWMEWKAAMDAWDKWRAAMKAYNASLDKLNEDYNDWEIERMVSLITYPIFIVLGTIGNLLTFYVMRRGSLRKVSTCFYMAILALGDTGVLWCGAFMIWISYLTRYSVNPFTWTDCKLSSFLWYFTHHFSSALLVIMSVEKCFALYFPLKTKSVCTVKTAKWVTLATILSFIIFESQFFFIRESKYNGYYNVCAFVKVSENYQSILNRLDSVLYCFGPITIIVISNCAIIYQFAMAKWKNNLGGTQSTNQALSKSAVKGTLMLMTVTITFIVLTGPSSVTYVITDSPPRLLIPITHTMAYVNHSINTVLYCIVGSRFRNEMLNALCFWCRNSKNNQRNPSEVASSNTRNNSPADSTNTTNLTASPI